MSERRPGTRPPWGSGGKAEGDLTGEASAELAQLRRLAHLMDEAFELPILGVRVGLDSILGLIPGIGDVAGAVAGGWIVLSAVRFGASASVVARMLLNLGGDALVGAVPLLGDIFDVAFKANRRNIRLLELHLIQPAETRQRSRALLLGAGIGFVAMLILTVSTAWWLLHALFSTLTGRG